MHLKEQRHNTASRKENNAENQELAPVEVATEIIVKLSKPSTAKRRNLKTNVLTSSADDAQVGNKLLPNKGCNA